MSKNTQRGLAFKARNRVWLAAISLLAVGWGWSPVSAAEPLKITPEPPADRKPPKEGEKPKVKLPTAMEAAVDCEWKAANRYDDAQYTTSALARRIMGICAVELIEARRAFGLSLHDPQIELDEFRQAVDIVDAVRKTKR